MITWGTASGIEILWTLMALVGLVTATWGLWTAQQDLWAVEAARGVAPRAQDKRLLVARYSRRRELISTFVQLVLTVVGIRALLLPPNPGSGEASAWAVGVLFFLAAASLTGCSLLERWDRRRFNRLP